MGKVRAGVSGPVVWGRSHHHPGSEVAPGRPSPGPVGQVMDSGHSTPDVDLISGYNSSPGILKPLFPDVLQRWRLELQLTRLHSLERRCCHLSAANEPVVDI